MKNIICLLSSIFIISCSGSYTLEGLKTSSIDSGRVFSFEVNKNYEEVYQIIMKKIWNLGCGRASGDVFYDAKEAIIIQAVESVFKVATNISYIEKEKSRVTVYYSWSYEKNAEAIEKWVKEDYGKCR